MFRITNIQSRLQETANTRDDLLSFINEKSVWAEDRNELITLQLEQVAEDGEVLDNMTLSLPLQSIVEEALLGFGLKREKRGFPLLSLKKPQKGVSKEEPTSTAKEEPVEQISAEKIEEVAIEKPKKEIAIEKPKKDVAIEKPKKEVSIKVKPVSSKAIQRNGGTKGVIWKILSVVAVCLSLLSVVTILNQSKSINDLEKQISLQRQQGKVETVGRYFIASYYSGDKNNLTDFLSKDLSAEGVKPQEGQVVNSIIYENITESKDIISITFVLSINEKDSFKTVRLTLPFKKDKQSVYGYVLDGQPNFSHFGQ